MGWSCPSKAGKALTPSSGVNTAAEESAKQFGLTKSSGYRSPEESRRVGGTDTDDHTKGTAADFAGSPEKMDAFAKEAIASGNYKKVIWQGKDWISGVKVPGHDDHVHLSW